MKRRACAQLTASTLAGLLIRGIASAEPGGKIKTSKAIRQTKNKLRSIRIHLDFENTTISEAADYFRQVSRENDKSIDPDQRGINIVIKGHELRRRSTGVIKLEAQPMEQVFRKFCTATNMKYHVTDYGVVLVDKNAKPPAMARGGEVKDPAQEFLLWKLNNLIIPVVDFDATTLPEARDFLWSRCRELDVWELEPAKRGIKIKVVGKELATMRIHELKLRNVSTHAAIQAIAELTGVHFYIGDKAVTFYLPKERT